MKYLLVGILAVMMSAAAIGQLHIDELDCDKPNFPLVGFFSRFF